MSCKFIELRPDRKLLDPNFNGYKLSLESVAIAKLELPISVDKVKPDEDQYSLLHTKLFGLHNHLFGDLWNQRSDVYFIDKQWNIKKNYIDAISGRPAEISKVWEIPAHRQRKSGHYNLSLYFASDTIAVCSDGAGTLHIVDTDDRTSRNEEWRSLFCGEVLGEEVSFIVIDARCLVKSNSKKQLHCVLLHVEQDEKTKNFESVLDWVTLSESEDGSWTGTHIKQLRGKGALHYCALDENCKSIYICSDFKFKFTSDSENPIIEKKTETVLEKKKLYTWQQTGEDISITFKLGADIFKNDLKITSTATSLKVTLKDKVFLDCTLWNRIDNDLTTWNVETNTLTILVVKSELGSMWAELVEGGDETGEQILDPSIVEEVHQRLAHLCSDTEVDAGLAAPTLSSQQLEECDIGPDESATLWRISSTTHEPTHRAPLGINQYLFTLHRLAGQPATMVLRHDVDACIWQPIAQDGDNWLIKHEGTLLAFGYVQASKRERKFLKCAPDASYAVICESSRHIFIYRQHKPMSNGCELRNRNSGRRVGDVAQQQVISQAEGEILGIYAFNDVLYLLTESKLLVLRF